MTATVALIALMLALIGTMLAAVMLIVWREFGRLPHALTWAIASAVGAIHWYLTLGLVLLTPATAAYQVSLPPTLVARSALLYLGFRQRAGRLPRRRRIAGAWGIVMAASLSAALAGLPVLSILVANAASAAFLFASAALVGLGERDRTVAEGGVVAALVVMAISQIVVGSVDIVGLDVVRKNILYRNTVAILVPTSVAAIGLFSVFLIAADLSTRMKRLAQIDPLTGLLNRRGLTDAVAAMAAGRRRGGGAAVMADLDSFKHLNDRFGHEAGDAALRAFAALLTAALRPGDAAARTGGEEFALVFVGQTCREAATRIEALRAATERIRLPAWPEARISASFGIAAVPAGRDPTQATAALERAAAALVGAKGRGRNCIILADEGLAVFSPAP